MEIKSGSNRLIATGLTPEVTVLSATPSSAGAPGPPTPQEGVRAPAEVRERFLKAFFEGILQLLVISAHC